MRDSLVARIVASLALVTFAGCGSTSENKAGQPAAGKGTTLKLHGKQTGFNPGVGFGDKKEPLKTWAYSNSLTDPAGKPAGNEEVSCNQSPRAKTLNCTDTLVLPKGQIAAQGVMTFGAKSTLPVIGGTGSYEGVRGTLTTTGATRTGTDVVVHLK